jgi:hypothetical protein
LLRIGVWSIRSAHPSDVVQENLKLEIALAHGLAAPLGWQFPASGKCSQRSQGAMRHVPCPSLCLVPALEANEVVQVSLMQEGIALFAHFVLYENAIVGRVGVWRHGATFSPTACA